MSVLSHLTFNVLFDSWFFRLNDVTWVLSGLALKMMKRQRLNLFQRYSEDYNISSNGILFETHDKSSPTAPFQMATSMVMLVSHHYYTYYTAHCKSMFAHGGFSSFFVNHLL